MNGDAMRCYEIQERFGLDALTLTQRAAPTPGPGEVVVALRAASLNYRDLLMARGHYDPRQPLPLIPCSDGAGEVVALGEGVEELEVGARVATLFAQGWLAGRATRARLRRTLGGPLDGTLCEQICLPASGVIEVPEHLSWAEAATLPCAALTAWSALVVHGDVRAGQTVLTLGTGGVSTFALQLGVALGARVIVTSSSDEKLARAAEMGAEAGINYREHPEWSRQVRALTDGEGVDHVIEVGGAGTLQQSLRSVRPGGQVSLIGVLSGTREPLDLLPVLMRQVRVQGILVGHRDGFAQMNRAIAAHRLRPLVDRVFPFEQAREAFEYLASGRHQGKVCIEI